MADEKRRKGKENSACWLGSTRLLVSKGETRVFVVKVAAKERRERQAGILLWRHGFQAGIRALRAFCAQVRPIF